MDIEMVDQQLQAQETAQEIGSLANKLQAAAQGGNQDARTAIGEKARSC